MDIVISVSSDGAGRFVACCPELPGCVVRSDSRQLAEQRLRHAVAAYLASMDVAPPGQIRLVMADAR